MGREPIPTWFFVLVVVRLGHRYLLVQERKRGQTWYLPAGRVEPGEDLFAAALRETQEEAGLPITLDGILRIEHSPHRNGSARVRVIFLARPVDDTPPKDLPDEESLGAEWFTYQEIQELPLRGEELLSLFRHMEEGMRVYPLDLITWEGVPF